MERLRDIARWQRRIALQKKSIQERNGGSEEKGENAWCDVRAMSHHGRKPNSPYHPRHERTKYPNVGQGPVGRRPGRDHCRAEQVDDYQRRSKDETGSGGLGRGWQQQEVQEPAMRVTSR